MPAFLTHYACGIQGYHHMRSGAVKSSVRSYTHAYNMGLAGPDLFFYSAVELLSPGMTIGRIMHKYRTGAFLRNLYEESIRKEGEERKIALAYFTGFLGHYCLDSRTHAFIYRVCDVPDPREALGKHFRFEAAMDAFCCRSILDRSINKSHQMGLIRLSRKEKSVIARLLADVIRKTYPDADGTPGKLRLKLILHEYFLISGLLMDPTGIKEWIFCGLEKIVPGYPMASPLFINANHYGLQEKDWKRFYIRYKRGLEAFNALTDSLESSLENENADDFFKQIRSWSYHGFFNTDAASELPLKQLHVFQMYRPGSLRHVWEQMDHGVNKEDY